MASRVWFDNEISQVLQAFVMRNLTADQHQLLNELSVALVGKVLTQPTVPATELGAQSVAATQE